MKRILFFLSLVSGTCLVSCDDNSEQVIPADEAPPVKNKNASDEWKDGGENLFKGKIMDWRNSDSDEKLAISAKYLQNSDSVPSEEIIREHAETLVTCINESVDGMATMNDDPIAKVAASCLFSMGFLEENDHDRLRKKRE